MAHRAAMLAVALLASFSMVVEVAPATAQTTSQQFIAFTSDRDRNSEVYFVATDGNTAPMNITRHPAADDSPTWSPDGRQFAFVSDRSGNRDIWVWHQDDPAPVNVTNSLASEGSPTWSPDGGRIAFTRSEATARPDGGHDLSPGSIWVMELASGSTTRLTPANPLPSSQEVGTSLPDRPPSYRGDAHPTWAPDGSSVAFTRRWWIPATPRSYITSIFLVPGDGSGNPSFLARGFYDIGGLAWAPDGRSIVWSDVSFQTGARLQRLDVAAGTSVPIEVPLTFSHYTEPAFSADGTLLAFSSYSVNQDLADVYVWPQDGGAPVRLTTDPAWDAQPAFQPTFHAVGMFDSASGLWTLRQGVKDTRYYYGDPGDVPFMGDWNCDGVDTPGLFRQSDGFAYLRNHNTEGVADIRFFFGNPDDVPLAGDFDGDGCDTVSIYRPAEQRFYIINRLGSGNGGLGAADFSFDFGNPGDQPVVGDWDGDGRDEVGLHRESSGFFYWRNTLMTGVADGQIFFGDPGDRFVASDWDGDGVATPAVFRPAAGIVYFRDSLTEGVADSLFFFGGPSSYPVAGDFALP